MFRLVVAVRKTQNGVPVFILFSVFLGLTVTIHVDFVLFWATCIDLIRKRNECLPFFVRTGVSKNV